jgi:hypothetical protein
MPNEPEEQDSQPGCGCLLRLFWMFGGMAGLLGVSAFIVAEKTPWFVGLDIVYLAIVLSLCGARALDILKFRGQTGEGKPATLSHLVRYVLLIVLGGAALWVVAHLASGIFNK